MILHDGNCKEFNINHVPPMKANPTIWDIPHGIRRDISPSSPVSGWRYTGILHIGGKVISAEGFGDGPGIWEGSLTAPRAGCDMSWPTLGRFSNVVHRALAHGPSPDPKCQCGYRIVRSVTELSRYMRDTRGGFDDFPVSELPEYQRKQLEHLGDTVKQSLVAVSVLGCGGVVRGSVEPWHDPQGTVCVEWLATDGWVIASEGDPVVDALVDWGATVCVVPEMNDVHEVDECDKFTKDLALWRMSDPEPVGVLLRHGSAEQHKDRATIETRRYGSFGAAGVAVVDDGKVLLVRSDSRWQLPGGARLEGEAVGECAVREVLEETGVDLAGVPVRDAFVRSDGVGWSYTTVIVDAPGSFDSPVPQAEVTHVGWFDSPPAGTHPDLIWSWERLTAP